MERKRNVRPAGPAPGSAGDAPEAGSVRAVQRALRLLNCFSDAGPNLTLSEYARRTALPISTVSRLLATLEAEGMVRRNESGSFSSGIRLMQIGLAALQSVSAYDLADHHLRRLAEATGESAYLGIASGKRDVVYIRHSLSKKSVRHTAWLGRAVPRSGTAIGAALDGRVGGCGYVARRKTIEPGVTAIAAPIHDPQGMKIIAAINIVGPTFRITERDIRQHGAALVAAATAISRELGVPGQGLATAVGIA